jgi:hypothetical protein
VGNWTIMGTAEEREAFWRTHHEAWQRSNLNQREYCEAHALVLKRFENWRAKFKDEPEVPQKLPYRRGGRPSHMTGRMTVPMTKPAAGSMAALAAGAAGRRRFSDADKAADPRRGFAALLARSPRQRGATVSPSACCSDGRRL